MQIRIKFWKAEKCNDCNGSGKQDNSGETIECKNCEGKGEIESEISSDELAKIIGERLPDEDRVVLDDDSYNKLKELFASSRKNKLGEQ